MAHVQKRSNGRWRARYRAPDGTERSRTFGRRIDAERWLSSMEMGKARGEWIDPALGRVTFAQWGDEWSTTIVDLRPSTRDRDLRAIRVHMIPVFEKVALSRITNPMVRRFIADMLATGKHSPATVRKVGQILAKVIRAAVEAGLIARSPCDDVRLPLEDHRHIRFLTPERSPPSPMRSGRTGSASSTPPPTPGSAGASSPGCASGGSTSTAGRSPWSSSSTNSAAGWSGVHRRPPPDGEPYRSRPGSPRCWPGSSSPHQSRYRSGH